MRRVTFLGALIALGLVATIGRPVAQGNVAEIEQVKDNLYVITGGGGNTAAFVTDGGVVVVDTKNPNWGEAILDKIKTVTDQPVTMIVNTHTHGDHVGSNIDFPLPVEVVAHANTKSNMERMPAFQSADGRRYLPGQTYTDTLTLPRRRRCDRPLPLRRRPYERRLDRRLPRARRRAHRRPVRLEGRALH